LLLELIEFLIELSAHSLHLCLYALLELFWVVKVVDKMRGRNYCFGKNDFMALVVLVLVAGLAERPTVLLAVLLDAEESHFTVNVILARH